jgi:hypothetical protein
MVEKDLPGFFHGGQCGRGLSVLTQAILISIQCLAHERFRQQALGVRGRRRISLRCRVACCSATSALILV